MAMPMNTAVSSVNTYAWTRTTMISSAEMPTASGTEHDQRRRRCRAIARPNISANRNTNDRIARMRDVAAGHVRRESHGQRERPDEHAHDLRSG